MNVTCTLCEGEDAKVPYQIIKEHIELIHGDEKLTPQSPASIELQYAFIHMCVALNNINAENYGNPAQYHVVLDGIERIATALLAVIEINGELEQ
jgi:hypothetical protein